MSGLKSFLRGCYKCGIIPFIKLNYFSKNIERKPGCYLFAYRGSIVSIDPTAKVVLNGTLFFNAGKFKGSRAESYLFLEEKSHMVVQEESRINYGSTVHITPKAELLIGSLTTNVGINIQVKHKIVIGQDCMLGRNATIFDSAYHPTGVTRENMKTTTDDVVIGDHVWVGANSIVTAGTHIGAGSMVSSHAYISGVIPEATTVARASDMPTLVGYMWARTEDEEYISQAMQYYKVVSAIENINEKAVDEYAKPILSILQPQFPSVDFASKERLISSHVLDSLALIGIVKRLENYFQIKIPFDEIRASNFDNINAMATLIYRLKQGDTNEKSNQVTSSYPAHDDEYKISVQNTLIEYVKAHAERNPGKIAVFSGNRYYTYENLYTCALRYGTYLQNMGLHRGERVVVKSIQSVDYIIIYMAVHYAGGVITTLEKSAPNEKILEIAKIVEAKIVICDDLNLLDDYIFIDSSKVFEDLESINLRDIRGISFPNCEDSADILFTTGTTGESKGVELSHAAVVAGARNIAAGCEMKRETVLVVPNPISHSNAIKNMGACFITGCSFFILDGMTDLKAYFEALDCKYGKVATVLPPAAIRTLFQLAKDKLREYKNKLDYLMAAMAPLLEPDRVALRELLPNTRLYNHYGCSESSSICIYDFSKYAELKNCVGKPMPHSKVFFVDDQKKEIASSPDKLGLLAVKGDATMKGYFKAPELTATIKNGDIIYTKDVGYMDKDGFVYVLGRDDDVINVGGLKVSPLEVEAATSSYDGVVDCICIGVDDEISGQALKLLVVPGKTFEMDTLRKILAAKLQGYKNPTNIEIVEKVERTYNGKVNRKFYRK